jgi:uncharacterized membrane protein
VSLAVVALTRRTLLGKLLFAAPAVYVGKQAVSAVKEMSAASKLGHGVLIDEHVYVDKDPQEVYRFFRNFENLPKFMHHTHDVRESDGTIHWVAEVASGVKIEWDGELIDDEPGKLISWRSAPQEPFEETGTVRFEPAGSGTNVLLRVAYDFGWTPAGSMLAKATAGWTSKMVSSELQSLKRIMESGVKEQGTHIGAPSPGDVGAPTQTFPGT